jgi:hypothetical protein
MANANKKHAGAGSQGKGDGSGAMSETSDATPPNKVLSNRDKAQHTKQRGQDGKHLQAEQRQDNAANRRS